MDGYIVAACMTLMGLEELDGTPKQWAPSVLLHLQSKDEQFKYLMKLAHEILKKFVNIDKGKLYISHFSICHTLVSMLKKKRVSKSTRVS